ncbi:MAG: hypothetical protein HQL25_03575 [Candidatus Omnitrophica bacterium]|nr:hypothetical protein [Candidatus Omnitrophota bacterium]
MLKRRKVCGQSILEYMVYFTVIVAVFVTISTYFKRGLAGKWKASVDDLGDQYDPRTAESHIYYKTNGTTVTTLKSTETPKGQYTNRFDTSDLTETKTGNIVVK